MTTTDALARQLTAAFDHAHPAAVGAVMSALLPFDHLVNSLWAVGTSVASWALVRLIARVFHRKDRD